MSKFVFNRRSFAAKALWASVLLLPALDLPAIADELRTVRFGTVAGIGLPGVFAGIEQGYFEEEGIEVEVSFLGGGPALVSAVVGGSLDIAHSDTLSWVAAVASGQELLAIAPVHAGRGIGGEPGASANLVVRGESDIREPADLVGKTVSLTQAPLNVAALRGWLKDHGVDYKQVNYVSGASIAAVNALLQSGNVDGALILDPATQQAQVEYSARIIGEPYGASPDGSATGVISAKSSFIAENPELVEGFVRAAGKGAEYFINGAGAEERARLVAKYTTLNLEELQKTIPNLVQSFHYQTPLYGPINIEATQRWVDLAKEVEAIPTTINIADHLHETAR